MNKINIKFIILAVVLAVNFHTACSQQEKTDTLYQLKKLDPMRKFDVETFKKNKNKEGNRYQFETEKALTIQWEERYLYYEQINYKKYNFIDVYVYYKDTHTVCACTRSLYSSPVGITYEYDRKGNITKETDWETPYKFSMDDLRAKILKEYNVDIYVHTPGDMSVINRTTNPIPLYEIIIPVKGYPSGYKRMNVNGTTGDVIVESMPDGSDRILHLPDSTKTSMNKKGFWGRLFG